MRDLMRAAVLATILVAAGAAPTGAATVARERVAEGVELEYHSAIAVGSDGVVHRVFQYVNGSLVHAWRTDGALDGAWVSEVVDSRETLLDDDDIAVDAEGRVHVAYFWNNREDSSEPRFAVIHAVRETGGWVRTTLATPNVLSTWTMDLDADGRPHVAWLRSLDDSLGSGPAVVAAFDGASWNMVETSVNGSPRDLRVDAEGNSHLILIGDGGRVFRYLTDASGTFAEETLPVTLDLPRLALDGDGRAHIAGFLAGAARPGTLRHLVRGSSGWEVDATLYDSGANFRRSDLHLETGPDSRVHILYDQLSQEVWDGDAERWLLSFDGSSWERQRFGTRLESAELDAAAVGPDGILHVVCGGAEAPSIDYFRIGGPELEVDASGLRVAAVKGGVSVRGRIRLRNVDENRSAARVLRLARTAGEEPVGRDRRIPSLRPGARRSIRVSILVPDPAPGERLLGEMDFPGRAGSRSGVDAALDLPLGE